ncbi:ribosomal RNA large subunit methyltransferase J [Sphaceloma murrayae]|uniref:Ribosomal RNA large subunit methyltransferase J n=1 Tax=Sphaceloma murrayae TaxID=2082308 RepID=A0A2K1QIR7_9PEZI|nr:ribosomal RNA large subunit methyltransferase J [Sphaceloma murrayae]
MEPSSDVHNLEVYTEDSPANAVIHAYLISKSPTFVRLTKLREEGWKSKDGDAHFEKQKINAATNGFSMSHLDPSKQSRRILDLCMAPGAFLQTALFHNPNYQATALTLGPGQAGKKVEFHAPGMDLHYLDITMLAADMGMTDIPPDHPDANDFLPKHFDTDTAFDLVICDGQVLREHPRAPYRERREARRLMVTQLAIGLDHISPGGTMIICLHKMDRYETVRLIHTFGKFSTVKVFKPKKHHSSRSSFYLVAQHIQPRHPAAVSAIACWKTTWRIATLGSGEQYQTLKDEQDCDVHVLLHEFGDTLVRLGESIWETQAVGLENASWRRGKSGKKYGRGPAQGRKNIEQ